MLNNAQQFSNTEAYPLFYLRNTGLSVKINKLYSTQSPTQYSSKAVTLGTDLQIYFNLFICLLNVAKCSG